MKIKQLLNEQIELLHQMCLLLEKEYEILKSGKPQEIALLAEEKNELQQKLEICENQRVHLMGNITLSEYEKQSQGEVTMLANQYRILLPRISELIQLNQLITEMGVKHYNGMLKIISSSAAEKIQTYGQHGYMSKKDVKTSAILNRQA